MLLTNVNAQISGIAYYDYNGTLTRTSARAEPGVPGVVVFAYLPNGTVLTDTTDSSGAYSFTAVQIPSGSAARIEFTGLPNNTFDGHGHTTSGQTTTVQFVTGGTATNNVNLPVSVPAKYTETNPILLVPCYVSGNPFGGGTGGTLDALVGFELNSAGNATSFGLGGMPKDPVAYHFSASEIGTTWGVAYSKTRAQAFVSAFIKRHSGIGPLGEGGIYIIDQANKTTSTIINWLDVSTIGINVGTVGTGANPAARNLSRGLNASATTADTGDPLAYDAIGKVGIGDIDISADESTLWLVNLFDRKLYSIQIDSDNNPATLPTSADVQSFSIPNPCGANTQRPFALKVYDGNVYLGLVCEGALEAFIYKFDGTNFTDVLINGQHLIPLNYAKGFATNNCSSITGWYNWISTLPPITCGAVNATNQLYAYPTPMFADIEFDEDGSLIMAFNDRTGHQIGASNTKPSGSGLENYHGAGDLLRACNVNGTFVMQGGTGCGNKLSNSQGPGGGEYYTRDEFNENLSYVAGTRGVIHQETVTGGMTTIPGSGELAISVYDPYGTYFLSGGINFLNNATGGGRDLNYLLYVGENTGGGLGTGAFSKANGLGDIEVMSSLAPLEIGNRIWLDTDIDGIQDPTESPIPNVCLELFADFNSDGLPDGSALGTTQTSAFGAYLFTSLNIADGDPVLAGNQAGPQPNKTYLIRICNSDWTNGEGTGDLLNLVPALSNFDASNNGDARDSDGVLSTDNIPQIPITTGQNGQNEHTLDFGFRMPCSITVTSATPSACDPGTVTYSLDVVVTYSNAPSGNIHITTSNGATISVAQTASPQTITLTNLPSNGVQDIDVTAAFALDAACTHTLTAAYDAPPSCLVCPILNCSTVTVRKF